MKKISFRRILPSKILVMSFIVIILIGTFFLSLPIAVKEGQDISILTALFTATSAVSVTGLSLVDVSLVFSPFGKSVILILIQLGGLGIMTFSTLVFTLIGKQISYQERKILKEDLNTYTIGGVIKFLKRIVLIVIGIETIGAIFLTFGFARTMPLKKAMIYGVFHSVSAFCNAGFSLFSDSIVRYSSNGVVTLTIAILISLGGIGFAVINSTINYYKTGKKTYNLTSKLALLISFFLTVGGTIVFFIFERSNPGTIGNMGIIDALNNSFFQSVTTRTAGFNSIPMENLRPSTLFLFLILMFIGASPGSTGGGLKTTTFGIIMFYVMVILRNEKDLVISNRRVPWEVLHRAMAILIISLLYITVVVFLILMTNEMTSIKDLADAVLQGSVQGNAVVQTSNLTLDKVIFEVISAFATVGVSQGITADLNVFGRILLILTMLIGRVGPLTFMLAFSEKIKVRSYKYPQENVLIG
ncbi:TrkH family potassium uptake protein [Psychrilyobacter atlanticus]|uniref:TrkH family potassium uptake protein n=1 Tax=Psychrilyobacter atlanticus TaxID=271091 RepID=UPI000410E6D7|nr:potassium transporter TrkG [Psychrilyobacter atlanticus]